MKLKQLEIEYDIKHWAEYKPLEAQYVRYSPHVILAALKIEDTFIQINNARLSLYLMDVKECSNSSIIEGKGSLNVLKSKFLFDALACYNYAIDLSWQTLYLYFGDNTYNMLMNKEKYNKALKGCNQETVLYYLILASNYKARHCVTTFFTEPLIKELREAYNYIKHRGTFDIEGIQTSIHRFPLEIDGIDLRMSFRESINLEEWKNKLIEFDIKFYNYFNSIISILMPSDFKEEIVNGTQLKGVLTKLLEVSKKDVHKTEVKLKFGFEATEKASELHEPFSVKE